MVNKPILEVLDGHQKAVPPVWLMRQAGRYLPEYRAVREQAGGFLDLVFSPELAAEVTLLGFCGAPWTVATYMVAGHGTPDQAPARMFAYRDRPAFGVLIDVLVEASAAYLVRQLQAGADAVQIFDTWAGILSPDEFHRWCIEPVQHVVTKVREVIPGAKIIGFPRGAGTMLPRYATEVAVNAVGLDWMVDPALARDQVQSRVAVQGNLDPLALVAGGAALDRAVDLVLEAFAGGPFIFNLGHGIVPETPIAHVERMLQRVRQWRG